MSTRLLHIPEIPGHIYAGPYATRILNIENALYIKLAPEIDGKCDIECPIEDFSIPENEAKFRDTINKSIKHLKEGKNIFVGCRGGNGRTGLFLAVLYKNIGTEEPIKYIRKHYSSHAIETSEQEDYVTNFSIELNDLHLKIEGTCVCVLRNHIKNWLLMRILILSAFKF